MSEIDTTDNDIAIGTVLRRLIEEQGRTITSVAKEIGVKPTALSAILRGQTKSPTWATICKLADALGVSPGEFRDLQTGRKAGPSDTEALLRQIDSLREKNRKLEHELLNVYRLVHEKEFEEALADFATDPFGNVAEAADEAAEDLVNRIKQRAREEES